MKLNLSCYCSKIQTMKKVSNWDFPIKKNLYVKKQKKKPNKQKKKKPKQTTIRKNLDFWSVKA